VPPFQVIEQVNEPRAEEAVKLQMALFNRSLELKNAFKESMPGRRKVAVKVVDIFGNDTMKIVEISI
jgi:hypothetical protein